MVLYFLAVVGEREVLGVHVAELHRGGGTERNALVGGTVEILSLAVEVDHVGACVVFCEFRERSSGAELSGIDEVRSFAAALGHEIAELEGSSFYEKMYKLIFVVHDYPAAPARSAKMLEKTFVFSVRISAAMRIASTITQSPM